MNLDGESKFKGTVVDGHLISHGEPWAYPILWAGPELPNGEFPGDCKVVKMFPNKPEDPPLFLVISGQAIAVDRAFGVPQKHNGLAMKGIVQ